MERQSGQAVKERRGASRPEPPPIAEAKLAVPSVRHRIVDRPRIRQALDAGADAALTLVAAPAGYGKTTAVRAWCAGLDASLVWVTLDAGDGDPTRLWRYVATAFERVRSGLGRTALQRLAVPGIPVESAIDELMSAASGLGGDVVIVLDDLHAVPGEDSLSSIAYALSLLPPNARIVAVTRVDPALGLARLRAGGALAELRADELAFTPAEAQALIRTYGEIDLGAGDVEALVERTAGWPAALVLSVLWLRTVDDPVRAVRAFGGDNRFVADYLSNEVLASLDDDRRSFLEGAAILGEFTPELCDAVLDRSDSAAVLDELEHRNLFLSRLDRGGLWRMHQLFAEYAQARIASHDPAAATRIHRRAAEWHRSQGMPVEAVEHASAAEDYELAAELLAEHHLTFIRSGGAGTLLRLTRALPDEVLVAHPELAGAAAIAAGLVGGSTMERRRLLRLAELTDEGQPTPYVESMVRITRAALVDGGVAQAVLDGRRAVDLAERHSDEALAGALAAYARALFFAGALDEAAAAALRVLEHPAIERRVPGLVLARATLAFVAAERGRVDSARRHAEKAKAAVSVIGTSRSWLGANASAAVGAAYEAGGDLVEAEHELASAEHFFRDEVATQHQTWLLLLLARVRLHRGRLDDAAATLRSAREALAELSDAGRLAELAAEVERELDATKARASTGELIVPPSQAELAVLRLLDTDLSTREIGERLFLSPNTIRSHRRALYRKLDVHSREEAIGRATALGLLGKAQSPR